MTVLERFLKYVSINTTSCSEEIISPSSEGQLVLAELLKEELEKIGADVDYDKNNGYLYAVLKGVPELPKVGFIAHMDTSEAACGENIIPQIISNYNGKDIELGCGDKLTPELYPDLNNHIGKTLITTDGKTLLGADDKAGIAEIMMMLEHFSKTKDLHGDICVAFTPDEEIGKGMDKFNYEKFKAPIAYTIDGSILGELSYENFNAATVKIEIKGRPCHCGTAKNVMVNAILLANAIMSQIPDETPANTEGYEGFFHVEKIEGTISTAYLEYLIRDFDKNNFEQRKKVIETIVNKLNEKYDNRIKLSIKDSYYNMKNIIEEDMSVVEIAKQAMKNVGVNPNIIPIRGGTDGTSATYNGLPCPNIGIGGHNFHGPHEYIAVEDMEKTTEILISIVRENTSKKIYTKTNNISK